MNGSTLWNTTYMNKTLAVHIKIKKYSQKVHDYIISYENLQWLDDLALRYRDNNCYRKNV